MARTKSHPLNYWRTYFQTAKDSNIFSIIDQAIKVAASDFPKDFSFQRDRIVARLSSVHSSSNDEKLGSDGVRGSSLDAHVSKERYANNESDQVSTDQASQNIDGEVLKIKEVLQNNDNEASIFESLTALKMMAMTVEILGATAIGKVVSCLKKHGSKQIRDLARTLVDGWKVLVDEYLATQDSKQHPSSDVLGKQNKNEQVIKKEVAAVKPNMASKNNKRKMQCLNEEVAEQMKMETTKRKLHERYEQIENTKKQRMIQVLEVPPKQVHKVGSDTANKHGKTPGSAQGRISDKLLEIKRSRLVSFGK